MSEEYIEITAKTKEDAITEACRKLSVTSSRLDYIVIQENTKGFLGLNAKPAIIKARIKDTSAQTEEILKNVLEKAENREAEKPAVVNFRTEVKNVATASGVMTEAGLEEAKAKNEAAVKEREAVLEKAAAEAAEKKAAAEKANAEAAERRAAERAARKEREKDEPRRDRNRGGRRGYDRRDRYADRKNNMSEKIEESMPEENEAASSEMISEISADAASAKAREDRTRIEPEKQLSDEKIKELTDTADKFLTDVFGAMNMQVEKSYRFDKEWNIFSITLTGEDMGLLIGKRGQTLDSLQYLISLVVNKKTEGYVHVKCDTENYRERRKETLENLARNMAYKVKRTHRSCALEPMNPYERRIIHSALQNDRYVTTYSEGEEPYRKVIIALKNERR